MDLLSAQLPNGDHSLHRLVLFLLDSGVSANGDHSLHPAVAARDLALLLDHAADVKVPNNTHDTPHREASELGDADVLELLSSATTAGGAPHHVPGAHRLQGRRHTAQGRRAR